MKKLPDLEAWAIFAKVAELGSFARAAAEFSLSQATVSKAISRLEASMQTVLFHRTSRSMSLTDSGQAALVRAARILEEGRAVEADMAELSRSLRGTIRLSAPMSFGIPRLAPLFPEFMALHPDVQLDVHFDDKLQDLVNDGYDMALRVSKLVDSSLLARQLCEVHIRLVGTPGYFARHGRPRHPRDLAKHRALLYTYSRTGTNWRFTHKTEGEYTHSPTVPLQINNAEALAPALMAGLGLALQPDFLCWKELESGALQTVMEDWTVEPLALHLVTPPGRGKPARVRALIDYLADKLAREPWAQRPNGTL